MFIQPKYIESLLASASERKAEQLRVQERKIQREREEEKELYGEIDKEKFVTEAYKKALEEQRKVEEEEKRKEGWFYMIPLSLKGIEADLLVLSRNSPSRPPLLTLTHLSALEDVTKKKDMTDFYRNVLDATARTVPLPGSQPSKPSTAPSDEPQQQREEKPAAMKAGVKMNDSEEIVDKRDLLSAGLNVIGKPAVVQRKAEAYRPARYVETNKKLSREEETRRALEMVEAQRREREEEERKEQEEERRKLAESLAKQNTEDTVSEAKRRYLERKRKREEEAKEA